MKYFGPLAVCLVLIWAAACGDDTDNPVSKTPAPYPSDSAPRTGNVVFSPIGADFTALWGTDDYALEAAAVAGDTLKVTLSYSGGCRTHRFTLVAAESFLESDPVQLGVAIAHDADGDPCEAYPTEVLHFILDPIKARYRAAYGPGTGTIVLGLARAPDGPLVYRFD